MVGKPGSLATAMAADALAASFMNSRRETFFLDTMVSGGSVGCWPDREYREWPPASTLSIVAAPNPRGAAHAEAQIPGDGGSSWCGRGRPAVDRASRS